MNSNQRFAILFGSLFVLGLCCGYIIARGFLQHGLSIEVTTTTEHKSPAGSRDETTNTGKSPTFSSPHKLLSPRLYSAETLSLEVHNDQRNSFHDFAVSMMNTTNQSSLEGNKPFELATLPSDSEKQNPQLNQLTADTPLLNLAQDDTTADKKITKLETEIWDKTLDGMPPAMVKELMGIRNEIGLLSLDEQPDERLKIKTVSIQTTKDEQNVFIPHHFEHTQSPTNSAPPSASLALWQTKSTKKLDQLIKCLEQKIEIHTHNISNHLTPSYQKEVGEIVSNGMPGAMLIASETSPTMVFDAELGPMLTLQKDSTLGKLKKSHHPWDICLDDDHYLTVMDPVETTIQYFTQSGRLCVNDENVLCLMIGAHPEKLPLLPLQKFNIPLAECQLLPEGEIYYMTSIAADLSGEFRGGELESECVPACYLHTTQLDRVQDLSTVEPGLYTTRESFKLREFSELQLLPEKNATTTPNFHQGVCRLSNVDLPSECNQLQKSLKLLNKLHHLKNSILATQHHQQRH